MRATNTMDPAILCEKQKLYGFQDNSIEWFRSFLTGRSQKVFT